MLANTGEKHVALLFYKASGAKTAYHGGRIKAEVIDLPAFLAKEMPVVGNRRVKPLLVRAYIDLPHQTRLNKGAQRIIDGCARKDGIFLH